MLKPGPDRLAKGLWWDRSWNLVGGCTPVDESCANCWGAREAHRLGHNPNPKTRERYQGLTDSAGRWTGKVRFREALLDLPLRTRKPCVWAVWMDLFHEALPVMEGIAHAFLVMSLVPHHLFLVLTKRPGRMEQLLRGEDGDYDSELDVAVTDVGDYSANPDSEYGASWLPTWAIEELRRRAHYTTPRGLSWPLPNVWLGTSACNQAQADERIPELLGCPAALHFVSCEPLLGAIDLRRYMAGIADDGHCTRCGLMRWEEDQGLNHKCPPGFGPSLDFVIAGGESGPEARPTHPDHVRSLRDQCQAASVPFFFKQWGCGRYSKGEWPNQHTDWKREDAAGLFGAGRSHFNDQGHRQVNGGRVLDGREWLQWPERRAVEAF